MYIYIYTCVYIYIYNIIYIYIYMHMAACILFFCTIWAQSWGRLIEHPGPLRASTLQSRAVADRTEAEPEWAKEPAELAKKQNTSPGLTFIKGPRSGRRA